MTRPPKQSESRLPVYRRVASLLRDRIEQGAYSTGEFLPPERELASELSVSRQTIRLAVDVLRVEGWLSPEQGRGTRIRAERTLHSVPSTLDHLPLAALIIYGTSRESSAAMFQGCAAVMQRANYHLIVAETAINARQRVADEAAQLRSLMDKGIRAMIIYAEPTDQNRALLEEALADGVYVVQIDRYLPGLPCDYVGIDNLSAAEEMMDHLLHVGHRRVAFLSVRPEPSSCQERLQGYRRALQLHGMPDADEDLIAFCDARKSVQGEIARILDRWLALPDPPTAIFASNDSLALFVMQALQQRQIAIPNEMALAGMDNLRVTSFVTPALTTVEQPFYEMGEVAAQLLLSRLAGAYEGEARRVMLPTRLIVRQSCGSAQAAPKRAGEIAFAGPREG